MADGLLSGEADPRVTAVDKCFGSSGQSLAIPGRVLLREGILTKMCRKGPKPRQFFLFDDLLVYGNIVINKKKYNKQHVIPLEQVELESLEDDGLLQNGWTIKTSTKSFAVYAATPTEKVEWMAHIKKTVLERLWESGKKPAEKHAAVWVLDSEAPVCKLCQTKFSLFNRRHHCRQCGSVMCGQCSKHRALLPSLSKDPLRVCGPCHNGISGENQDQGSLSDVNADPSIEKDLIKFDVDREEDEESPDKLLAVHADSSIEQDLIKFDADREEGGERPDELSAVNADSSIEQDLIKLDADWEEEEERPDKL